MIFDYLVAPCLGEDNVALAIGQKSKEGWEPVLLTYAGNSMPKEDTIGIMMQQGKDPMIPKFVLIMRRPAKGQQAT